MTIYQFMFISICVPLAYVPKRSVVIQLDSPVSVVHLFKWSGDQVNNTGVVEDESSCISSFEVHDSENDTETEIEQVIGCYNETISRIDKSEIKNFSISVGATSDARLLSLKDPGAAEDILDRIEFKVREIANGSEMVAFDDIKVLDGKDEAAYFWISLNHLVKNFINQQQTTGLIYVDDVSSLMAYAYSNVTLKENAKNFALYGTNYTLIAKGDVCTGYSELHDRHLIKLILDEDPQSREIMDPCLAQGKTEEISTKILTETACAYLRTNSSFANSTGTYKFIGSHDYSACLTAVTQLYTQCESYFTYCPKRLEERIPDDMSFFFIHTVIADIHGFDFNNITSEESLVNRTLEICLTSWDTSANNTNNVTVPISNRSCFASVYIYTLLKHLYKFQEGNWDDFKVYQRQLNLDWSLGYMIYKTTWLDPLEPSKKLFRWYVLVAVDVVCVAFVALGVFLCCKKKGNTIPNVKIY